MSRGMRGGILGCLTILALWWALSLAVPSGYLPSPLEVIPRFFCLLPRSLSVHAAASLGRIGAALGLALISAVPAGAAIGRSFRLDRIFSPIA